VSNERPTADWLADARAGDPVAVERLCVRYRPWLRLLARHQLAGRLGGKLDASDVAQQALLEACRALPGFRGSTEAELIGWLRAILAGVLGDAFRHYHGTQARDLAREVSLDKELDASSRRLGQLLADSGPSPSNAADRNEQGVLLAGALSRLPEDYREVIALRNLEGLSHEEVAARMGRAVGAVRMLWLRALSRLRRELGQGSDFI
jgi:RNA polymerase sigma-70 factor (ECF subfamily)